MSQFSVNGWSVWAGWSGWSGWSKPSLAMAQDPAMVRAVQQVRGALVKPDDDVATKADAPMYGSHHPVRTYPRAQCDEPEAWKQWDPPIRQGLLRWALLDALRVVFPVDTGTAQVVDADVPLVTLRRPQDLELLRFQADKVYRHIRSGQSAKRDQRLDEVLTQMDPPLAYLASFLPLHPERTPCTLALIDAMLETASDVVQRVKHGLAVPRPYEVDRRIHPMIPTPGHAAFPSGHATQSAAVCEMLIQLLQAPKEPSPQPYEKPLRRLARRIALNREVAGLHYPMDSLAGAVLGTALAHRLVARSLGATQCTVWAMSPNPDDLQASEEGGAPANGAMAWARLPDADEPLNTLKPWVKAELKPVTIAPDGLLAWVWRQARQEWGYDT